MIKIACGLLCTSALLGFGALADDSLPHTAPTPQESMKTCIEKQKTADVSMSKSEMTRICKDEMKRQKLSGQTTPPPVDAPVAVR